MNLPNTCLDDGDYDDDDDNDDGDDDVMMMMTIFLTTGGGAIPAGCLNGLYDLVTIDRPYQHRMAP